MLVTYYGNDIPRRRQAVAKLKQTLLKKRPDAEVFEIDADEFSSHHLTELVGSRGLFEDKYLVFMYQILSVEEGEKAVREHVEDLQAADHVFILIEDTLSSQQEKLLSEHAHTVKKLHKESPESEEHKPWPLADAYGKRDSKTGWLELQKALKSPNNTPESVQGLLWWQTRMLWLARTTDSASEAGVSGYPYKKATKFSKNFSEDELMKKSQRLIAMYHEAHRGEYDLAHALEQFMLEL